MNQEQRIEYFMSEIARLSNQIVDLQDDRDALAAQVEALKEALKPAVRLMRTTGQYSGWHEKADETESLVNRELTTQQHLAEVRAQAVLDFAKYVDATGELNFGDSNFVLKESNQYADSIRQEKQ